MSGADKQKDIILYSSSESGHRGSYLKFVATLFSSRRGTLRDVCWARQPVFFLMIEDSFPTFALTAIWRALFGRRTLGLLFRPKPASEGMNLKLRTKRLVLKLMKRVPSIRTITIVPFSLNPGFSQIADDWIYDFQLWDLTDEDRERINRVGDGQTEAGGLAETVRATAKGNAIICALGLQDRRKGFDILVNASCDVPAFSQRYHIVSAGRVADELKQEADILETLGGTVIDRHISDTELMALYSVSDLVWALYAADYDQASGILGRAVQLGIPAIVRSGSLSHKLCEHECLAHIDADEASFDRINSFVPKRDEAAGRAAANRFRAESINRLARALDVPPSPRLPA